tara:strand:- start:2587 stop:3177 length:591 start_codon:yes stop_codon:yes gene_type:complete
MKFIRKTTYYSGIVYEWNLPTGHTCPFAKECLVKVDRESGKFDNKSDQYKCYAASAERFPAVRNHRWTNFDAVRRGERIELPKKAEAVRIHMSGDFFSQAYFDQWLEICEENSSVEFWAYTKSLNYWVNRLGSIPENLVLTASYGGKHDRLIDEHDLKNVIVVKSKEEAIGRPIDYNDDIARQPNVNFYLIDNFAK